MNKGPFLFPVRIHVVQFGGGGIVRECWFDGRWWEREGGIAGGDAQAFDEACAFYTRIGFVRMERRP